MTHDQNLFLPRTGETAQQQREQEDYQANKRTFCRHQLPLVQKTKNPVKGLSSTETGYYERELNTRARRRKNPFTTDCRKQTTDLKVCDSVVAHNFEFYRVSEARQEVRAGN